MLPVPWISGDHDTTITGLRETDKFLDWFHGNNREWFDDNAIEENTERQVDMLDVPIDAPSNGGGYDKNNYIGKAHYDRVLKLIKSGYPYWEEANKKCFIGSKEEWAELTNDEREEYRKGLVETKKVILMIMFHSMYVKKEGVNETESFDLNNYNKLTPVKYKHNKNEPGSGVVTVAKMSLINERFEAKLKGERYKRIKKRQSSFVFRNANSRKFHPLHADLRRQYCSDYMTHNEICIHTLRGTTCNKTHCSFTDFSVPDKQKQIEYIQQHPKVFFLKEGASGVISDMEHHANEMKQDGILSNLENLS